MNFIFSTIIVVLIVLLFTIFAGWIDKFNAAFAQNGTFKRVGEAVATDSPASPDASGGTSGGGQNPPEVEG